MRRAVVPLGVKRVLANIARESGMTLQSAVQSYKVVANARAQTEVKHRRIYLLTGTLHDHARENGRVISIIATTERGQIVHLRRVHSR